MSVSLMHTGISLIIQERQTKSNINTEQNQLTQKLKKNKVKHHSSSIHTFMNSRSQIRRVEDILVHMKAQLQSI